MAGRQKNKPLEENLKILDSSLVHTSTSWPEAVCAKPEMSKLFDGPQTAKASRHMAEACGTCTIRAMCLVKDLEVTLPSHMHGTRGGLTKPERKKVVKSLEAGDVAAAADLVEDVWLRVDETLAEMAVNASGYFVSPEVSGFLQEEAS